jgi:pimeloyl-ACP methyl ester carboxylesterase
MHLYYRSYGSGHPLIILHGLLGSSDNWQIMAKEFGSLRQVFTLDARNHGRSPHSNEFSYRIMSEDVRNFMDVFKLPSAVILGHSMGGKTAMKFALTYPDRVEKLVVVDIAPRGYGVVQDPILEALASLNLLAYREREEVDVDLAKKITDSAVRQFLMKNLQRDDNRRFVWKVNLDVIRKNYAFIDAAVEAATTFDKPTLFMRGALSQYIMPQDEPTIKKLFPNATITTIAGAGHWIHTDAPGEFAQNLMNFLMK